jgi:cell division transport system ATP-binding protein
MSRLGHLSGLITGSPIFASMSRRPVKTLIESQSPSAGEPAVIRLQRAAPPLPGGDGGWGVLSLTLAPGASQFLTGEAGSGKSAVLEMIAMARPPARGGVELFGRDVATVRGPDRFALRRRIGMMFQDLRLIDDLSAYDNVALAARAAGRRRGSYGAQIDELLAWVGLARRADDPAGDLDDEGRRRLALARAVINRPDVVIADEPSGSNGMAILKLLSDLNQAGTAILIATRDAELAARSGAEVTHLSRPSSIERDGGPPGSRR